jgi:hypothetical protein
MLRVTFSHPSRDGHLHAWAFGGNGQRLSIELAHPRHLHPRPHRISIKSAKLERPSITLCARSARIEKKPKH